MMLAATVFTGISFGSCSSEDLLETPGAGDGSSEGQVVTFSTGDESPSNSRRLLTTMDDQGYFFWTTNDHIFVKVGDTYVSAKSSISQQTNNATFFINGNIDDAASYPIIYAGNNKVNASQATSVEVKDVQTQVTPGDGTHIGYSGDCGVATATRTAPFKYNFRLYHRASYFSIVPRHAFSTSDVTLQKIVVTTTGSSPLAGNFSFDENTTTLEGKLIANGKNTITLNTSDFVVPSNDTVIADSRRLFDAASIMVFAPGTHALKFSYYVTINGAPRVYEKYVDEREFLAGHFTSVKHILSDAILTGNHQPALADISINDNSESLTALTTFLAFNYYMWDANEPFGVGFYSGITHPTTVAEIPTHSAQNISKDMPNANEMYWYVKNGNPTWDPLTIWSLDGGLTENSNGVWIKKKARILAEGGTFSSTIGMDDVDMRLVPKTYTSTMSFKLLSSAEKNVYFFLPAIGRAPDSRFNYSAETNLRDAYYWTSSCYPEPSSSKTTSYLLFFNKDGAINVGGSHKHVGAGSDPTWFK